MSPHRNWSRFQQGHGRVERTPESLSWTVNPHTVPRPYWSETLPPRLRTCHSSSTESDRRIALSPRVPRHPPPGTTDTRPTPRRRPPTSTLGVYVETLGTPVTEDGGWWGVTTRTYLNRREWTRPSPNPRTIPKKSSCSRGLNESPESGPLYHLDLGTT